MDLIISRTQTAVLNEIDLYLVRDAQNPEDPTLDDLWISILGYIMDERDRYPNSLLPSVYFENRVVFKNHAPRPMIRIYCQKVARYIETLQSKNLPRSSHRDEGRG